MIRGVSRQIVEVKETGNPYFERALLFVRAEYAAQSEEVLQTRGAQYVRREGTYSGLRRGRRRTILARIGWSCLCCVTGAAVGILIR